MNRQFKQLIDQMPDLMQELNNSNYYTYGSLGNLPQKGVYVFYDGDKPVYVGRTNRMRSRIKEHGRPGSGHNSAPFAFNMAKKQAAEKGIDLLKTRSLLEKDELFKNLFKLSKEKITKMQIKVIEINDPNLQALFELYASIELNTYDLNSFDNH